LLTHPMLDQLGQLGLSGMAQAFCRSSKLPTKTATLTHGRLARPLGRSRAHPSPRQAGLAARLRYARLRQPASVEDGRFTGPHAGLDRALFHKLTDGEWIDTHDNLILCGADRRGQILACLCPGSQGLPRQPFGPLSAGSQALPRTRARPVVTAAMPRIPARSSPASQTPHPRRLGPSTRSTAGAPFVTSTRSSRNAMGVARPSSPVRSQSTSGTPFIGDPTYAGRHPSTASFTTPTAIDLAGDSLRRRPSRSTTKD